MHLKIISSSAVVVTALLWSFAYFYGQMDTKVNLSQSKDSKAQTYLAGFNSIRSHH